MQLINERQQFPLVLACVTAACVIGVAFLMTHLVDPSPAAANATYWYLERSAGFTAYGLLNLSVLLGASSSLAIWDKWNMRKLMTQMHQYSALLFLPFLFFHLWGLYMDTSIPFNVKQLLVPLASRYKAVPTALGVLTLYAWILLIVSSYLREKIGVTAWRMIHILSYPMFVAVTIHGLTAGTDAHRPWAILIYLVPSILFFILTAMRLKGRK